MKKKKSIKQLRITAKRLIAERKNLRKLFRDSTNVRWYENLKKEQAEKRQACVREEALRREWRRQEVAWQRQEELRQERHRERYGQSLLGWI